MHSLTSCNIDLQYKSAIILSYYKMQMCSFCGICNITGNVKTYSESWHIPRHAYLIHILHIEATSTTSDVPGHGQSGQHLYLYTPNRSLHRHLISPDMQHPGDISGVCAHLGTSEATSETSGRDPAPDISCPQDVVRCCQTPPGTRAISQSVRHSSTDQNSQMCTHVLLVPGFALA